MANTSGTRAEGPPAEAPTPSVWVDSSLSVEDRAAMVTSAMTLDEKLSLVHGDVVLAGNGSGTNACVGHIPGVPRLRIPSLCMGDGPAGVGGGLQNVTQFPAPVVGSATWNVDLLQRYGAALGEEQAGKGRNVVLAPTINILRDPRWGRGAETLSEDPFLTARLGVAIVNGIQSNGVLATPKHFVANNQETLRLGDAPEFNAVDARIADRALHEIYFPAFRSVVIDARAGSVMCSYNRVNGVYACENPLLRSILREEWGFDGFVVSDWYFAHRSTVAAALAGMDVSMPGGASPFGFQDFYGPALKEAVLSGRVPEQRIDEMVRNILRPMLRLGLFGRPTSGSPETDVRSKAHTDLAREIASEGTVLLKNAAHVLPIDHSVHTIAIIGDDAGPNVQTTEVYGGFVNDPGIHIQTPLDAIIARAGSTVRVLYAKGTAGIGALPALDPSVLQSDRGEPGGLTARWYGNSQFAGAALAERFQPTVDLGQLPATLPKVWSVRWTGKLKPRKSGSYRFSLAGGGDVTLYINGKSVVRTSKQGFTNVTQGNIVLAASQRVDLRLEYSMAPTISPPRLQLGWEEPNALLANAVEIAKSADVAIVFAADDVSEGGDRINLSLPGDQDALIAAVAASNPHTVVVLHTGGPVLMPWSAKVSAVLEAWYPGQEAGAAVAAVLFGDVNPSGRLPMTFPAKEGDGPTSTRTRFPGIDGRVSYEEGLFVGYRYYDKQRVTPLYPFGFGLSYTRFRLSDLQVSRKGPDDWLVDGTVSNIGTVPGTEVVQLYVGFPADAGEPPWQLKGFERVTVAARAVGHFHFVLHADGLSVWNEKTRTWNVPAGKIRLAVGSSSRALGRAITVDTR